MEQAKTTPMLEWVSQVTYALREGGVLLMALAPLDGKINNKPLTGHEVLGFIIVGFGLFVAGVVADILSKRMLREVSERS